VEPSNGSIVVSNVPEQRSQRVADDVLQRLELNLHPNEASGLLTVEDETLLEAQGWEFAFWAVLDEGEIVARKWAVMVLWPPG
jgi:hypothetical protein